MATRKSSFGEVIHVRHEHTDDYEGYLVPGGLVEHITVQSPREIDVHSRARHATINATILT